MVGALALAQTLEDGAGYPNHVKSGGCLALVTDACDDESLDRLAEAWPAARLIDS